MQDVLCSIEGCSRRQTTRGWCGTHYQRWRRRGTTDPPSQFVPKPCSVVGCEQPSRRHGLCEKHSQRLDRHGDPLAVQQIQGDDLERFMQYVQIGPTPFHRPGLGRCWLWTGVRHRTRRYGRFWSGGRRGRYLQAHRWSYQKWVGVIPYGYEVDHLCRIRECVRPEHLEAVTPAENKRRALLP